ncbi:MAG: 50S ribosomal protein L29 [Desulfobulbus propionicus]|nr:MAG: 50S ribosomal protein L29 [Desulfobulbus propionicus]
MKTKEMREMNLEDLLHKEKEIRQDLFKLKFQHGIRKLENTARLRQLRKEIARIQTVVSEKR